MNHKFRVKQELFFADDNINDGEEQHGDHIHNINRTRTKWTSGMCNDILTCHGKAKALHSKDSCLPKLNGMKVGIMGSCKMFWEGKGYGYLGKTAENLRDKLGHIDKQVRMCMIKFFWGGRGGDTFKTPSLPMNNFCLYPPPVLRSF